MKPNATVMGQHVVRVNTTLERSCCQGLEWDNVEYRPCGLPPFVTVGDEDVQPVLCWRHLTKLGDTYALVVRPIVAGDAR